MADQMTPAEMRGCAHSLRVAVDKAEECGLAVGDLEMRAFVGNVRAGADALDLLSDVVEYAGRGDGYQGFLSRDKVLSLARGDTTNHENRSER